MEPTSGMVTFLTSEAISFKARQQPRTTTSTSDAEYIVATYTVKDLVWVQRFIKELKIQVMGKAHLYCDNQSAIRLIKNPEFYERSKHIDIRYHFIREHYQDGLFEISYVRSEDQKADMFTKTLTGARFKVLRESIGCIDASSVKNERGC